MSIRDLILLVMGAQLGLHYFPWRKMIGMELPRVAAYALGVLGMFVPLTMYLVDRGQMDTVQTLWAVIVSAGVMVFALYGFDHYLETVRKEKEKTQQAELLERQLREAVNGAGK